MDMPIKTNQNRLSIFVTICMLKIVHILGVQLLGFRKKWGEIVQTDLRDKKF